MSFQRPKRINTNTTPAIQPQKKMLILNGPDQVAGFTAYSGDSYLICFPPRMGVTK
jgi:hypothetical protein